MTFDIETGVHVLTPEDVQTRRVYSHALDSLRLYLGTDANMFTKTWWVQVGKVLAWSGLRGRSGIKGATTADPEYLAKLNVYLDQIKVGDCWNSSAACFR